jgi:hypothetical protein
VAADSPRDVPAIFLEKQTLRNTKPAGLIISEFHIHFGMAGKPFPSYSLFDAAQPIETARSAKLMFPIPIIPERHTKRRGQGWPKAIARGGAKRP